MKRYILVAAFVSIFLAGTALAQSTVPTAWTVTYTIGDTTRTFNFIAANDGIGSFRFRTPASTVRSNFPAVWLSPAIGRMNFSAEVQIPVSNTVRETGALVFKGTRTNDGRMVGPVIFVVDNVLSATPSPFSIRTGTFAAVPINITAGRADLDVSR